MLLQNKAKRLIKINGKQDVPRDLEGNPLGYNLRGDAWKLLPAGPAVDVPDDVCECAYVKALISNGDVEVVGQVIDAKAEKIEEEDDEELKLLKEEADELGVKYRADIKKSTLQKKVDEALEAKSE